MATALAAAVQAGIWATGIILARSDEQTAKPGGLDSGLFLRSWIKVKNRMHPAMERKLKARRQTRSMAAAERE